MKLNKRNVLIGIGATITVGTLIYILVNRSKKKKLIEEINDILEGNKPGPNDGGQKIISEQEYNALPSGSFPLKIGDKNKKIYDVQKMLNSKYGAFVDVDGKYGEGTWQAMCDKIWDKWWMVGECRDSLGRRRDISQSDYNGMKSNQSQTT